MGVWKAFISLIYRYTWLKFALFEFAIRFIYGVYPHQYITLASHRMSGEKIFSKNLSGIP